MQYDQQNVSIEPEPAKISVTQIILKINSRFILSIDGSAHLLIRCDP